MGWRRELERLKALGERATFRDKLEAYKAVREADAVDPYLAFFSIAHLLMNAAEDRVLADKTLEGISEHLDTIDSASHEASALERGWNVVHDDVIEHCFRENGEDSMADLYRDNRIEFERRYELGRQQIFGPPNKEMEEYLRSRGILD
jgi:hypothetical protein